VTCRAEKISETNRHGFDIPQIALPNRENVVPKRPEFSFFPGITRSVGLDFICPKLGARGGQPRFSASLVAVPKATMNEYRLMPLFEDDIRSAGQVFGMQPKSVTQGVQ